MIKKIGKFFNRIKKKSGVQEYRFKHISCMLSMKSYSPRSNNEYRTAVIRLFDLNNPHKSAELPAKVLEFPNIEKIRIRNLNVSYYLEGADLIINDLKELSITVDNDHHKIILRAYQTSVEERH